MKRAPLNRYAFLLPALGAALAFGQGCVGNIGGSGVGAGDDPQSQPQSCGGDVVPVEAVPLRRLNAEQYLNTLRDLTGDATLSFELEDMEGVITERAVRQLRDLGELVVTRQSDWTREVFPCDVTGPASDDCVDTFIADFGARAFRHPVTEEERTWLRGVYDGVDNAATFEEKMQVVLQVMLQSPAAVYMFEAGAGDVVAGEMKALTSYEVASRLSYFVWSSMPDDALFAAAADGELDTPDGLRAQAERLLADPRAEQNVQRFFSGWMQLDGGQLHHALEATEKDDTLYPEYDAALQTAMRTETEAFIKRTFFDEGGSFEKLFMGNYAYVNSDLAALYGVAGPSSGYDWVELDSSERGGLFTRAAFLTVLSTRNVTAPIRRGVWMMEEALCNALGEPPANVDDSPVEGGENGNGETLTVREDVELRTGDAECQACHSLINPLGFTFENYDAIGRYQTEEVTSGLPVDSSGKIQASDVDGDVANALELSETLAKSEQVRSCFATRWSEAALGHEQELDSCSKDLIDAKFSETGDMRELLLSIIESNAFRFVNISDESGS